MPRKIFVIKSMYIFRVPNWDADSGVEVNFQSAGGPPGRRGGEHPLFRHVFFATGIEAKNMRF